MATTETERVKEVQEGLGGIRDILLGGIHNVYIDRFKLVDLALRRAQVMSTFIAASPKFLIEALGMVVIAFLAYWISLREGGVAAAIPIIGAMAIGAQKLLPLTQQVYSGWSSFHANSALIGEVVNMLEQPIAEEYLDSRRVVPMQFKHTIVLKNICFRYSDTTPDVVKDVSLEIPKGSKVGIVGKTGSGKSTLMDLMLGLLEPTKGGIFIDGVLLDKSNRRNWQANAAHVPQSIYLTDASIAENIALGEEKQNIDVGRLRDAACNAQISEYVDDQPNQYVTLVGENGVRLSGGQRCNVPT